MAAYEGAQLREGTLKAAADLSSKQYHFVKLASATTVNVCSAITDVPIGILQNDPESGETAVITIFGISKMVADGTITGFGIHMHHTGGEYTIRQRLSGTDDTNFETAALILNTRLMESNPSGSERQNRMIQAHTDEVWTIGRRNVPENTGTVQYVYEAQFQVNRAELPRWSQIWEDDMYPVLERAIADDLLAGYVVLEHNTGGRFNWKILWLSETWDSIDDFEAAFFGAAPMDHPMWSMYTSHRDELWQTLPPAN